MNGLGITNMEEWSIFDSLYSTGQSNLRQGLGFNFVKTIVVQGLQGSMSHNVDENKKINITMEIPLAPKAQKIA